MIPAAAAAGTAGARLPALLVLAVALTVLASDTRAAESMYVVEQLVVGATSAPGGEGDRVATLKSGDRVDVVDRQGEEAQIQLPDGTSGWVKASYLSAQLPLRRRLQDQTAQVEKLEQEVARLQSRAGAAGVPSGRPAPAAGSATAAPGSSAGARSTSAPVARLGSSVDPPTATTTSSPTGQSDSRGTPPGAAARDPSPFMGSERSAAKPSWVGVIACSLVALLLGFLAGWRVLDRRIRRKYGGLRIY
jgi:hypothetical protein